MLIKPKDVAQKTVDRYNNDHPDQIRKGIAITINLRSDSATLSNYISYYMAMTGLNIDTAVPIAWADVAGDWGITPQEFVWCYDQSNIDGYPLNKYLMMHEVLKHMATTEIEDDSD